MSQRPRDRSTPRPITLAASALALLALLTSCGGPAPRAAPISAVTATAMPAAVLVEWTGGDGAASFVVYRSEDGGDPAALAEVPGDARSYLDHAVAEATSYAYAVAAVDPSGAQEPVGQSGEPVTPLPGVRLTVVLDGDGTVVVEGGPAPVTCADDCVVGFAPGAEVALSGVADGQAFAGFGALAPALARRVGIHRTTVAALVAVVAGLAARAAVGDHPVQLPDDNDARRDDPDVGIR